MRQLARLLRCATNCQLAIRSGPECEGVRNQSAADACAAVTADYDRRKPRCRREERTMAPEKLRVENDAELRKLVIKELNAALDVATARMADGSRADGQFLRLAGSSPCTGRMFEEQRLELREQVVKSLSLFDHPDVFAPLLLALVDENVAVRSVAANGLQFKTSSIREYQGEPLLQPLIDALGDSNLAVRMNPACAIANLHAKDKRIAVAPLVSLLHEQYVDVATAAIQSLASMNVTEAADSIFCSWIVHHCGLPRPLAYRRFTITVPWNRYGNSRKKKMSRP